MSAPDGRFAYAQARLQARLGDAPDAGDRQRIHAAGDLPALLATLRSTAWRRYTSRLAAAADPHELERHVRGEWLALVDEVARWVPAEWRPGVRWLSWLPYLPALQKIARGGRPPAWTRGDPVLGPLVAADPALRGPALAARGLQALGATMARPDGDVTAAWLVAWRALWPAAPPAHRQALERLVREVAACDAAARAAPVTAQSSTPLAALHARLLRLLRRLPLTPAAPVAYLALEALGLLDVRGAVLRRAAVDPGPAP